MPGRNEINLKSTDNLIKNNNNKTKQQQQYKQMYVSTFGGKSKCLFGSKIQIELRKSNGTHAVCCRSRFRGCLSVYLAIINLDERRSQQR